ncbi:MULTISPECIES: heme-degrading domain-containing protein [unclassified Tenacibaculum]|uniref:heme-degrading domain-containing protein n=1 Tax=unclassified Tenacibaculum TaxID=2635139 RepID=UPI001F163014|nr:MULTISPECIES: heme-binding protein [unclassified Tenacibaculum]MCF2875923.1 heme-binding protein [Tenacibaculum sp. Cn5-1]MCF2935998.1 heme-binding protein [Tenacibaculum sp. Cn5-34]MCG7512559.1 heme-binding protein [Tenacibaculum sp. Cn5-46]
MKNLILLIILFTGINSIKSQNKLTNQTKQKIEMEEKTLRKIELEKFNNKIGLEMGLAIVNLAKERNQNIAVQIERLNHIIFLFVDDNLPADKHNWLKRKANVAKHFEESSLSVKHDLKNGNMTLPETFALDPKLYLAKGGSIPIFVKNAGMIAVITVSGLHDEEDHKIIIDALNEKYIK